MMGTRNGGRFTAFSPSRAAPVSRSVAFLIAAWQAVLHTPASAGVLAWVSVMLSCVVAAALLWSLAVLAAAALGGRR